MAISIFDIFSIGIGPSSSHAMGPMRAAKAFVCEIEKNIQDIKRVKVELYGSLAFTGVAHGTDTSLLMGLEGEDPESVDPDSVGPRCKAIKEQQQIKLLNRQTIPFSLEKDMIFNIQKTLDYHPNGMEFTAFDGSGTILLQSIYFSIGGGFIINEKEINAPKQQSQSIPYPFEKTIDLLTHCKKHNLSIAEVMFANEKTWRSEEEIKNGLLHIADVMEASINKGIAASGNLPGKLEVRRRAPGLYKTLKSYGPPNRKHPQTMNWLNCFALAVNEENAAGGRVVTAPTNGAAGIIPSVLNYYKYFCTDVSEQGVIDFLLTAGAIAILYKKNASISGAEMGCQGEVGVACSMAAGALAAVLGGTIAHVENAAEIGMEHNLGLTCDPVAGLVQIPCIERNAMGAVKAINAARLALAESGEHKISLDMVIDTMREIGNNMNSMYKETSKGGLAVAVNVIEC